MHPEATAEGKTAVNLRIRASLKDRAKRLGLNLSQALEQALEREISEREQQAWLTDNREAIAKYNHRIEENGPALSAYRRF